MRKQTKVLTALVVLVASLATDPAGAVSTLDGWPSRTDYLSNDAPFVVFGVTPTRVDRQAAQVQLSFIAMSETILLAIKAVSFIIILIIMAVMANTMTMTARERLSEYATLKALGFAPGFVVRLLFGESLMIALIGGALGIALTFPVAHAFVKATGTLFPIFKVSMLTLELQWAASVVVGAIAAAWPAWRMSRIDIVQGLRHVA